MPNVQLADSGTASTTLPPEPSVKTIDDRAVYCVEAAVRRSGVLLTPTNSDTPGVTRDVISAEVAEGCFTLLDTGGLGYKGKDTPAALTAASEQQVEFAIATASLILFIVDGLEGMTSLDEKIARMLRKLEVPDLTEAHTVEWAWRE